MSQPTREINIQTCPKCEGGKTVSKTIGRGGCDYCMGEGVIYFCEHCNAVANKMRFDDSLYPYTKITCYRCGQVETYFDQNKES